MNFKILEINLQELLVNAPGYWDILKLYPRVRVVESCIKPTALLSDHNFFNVFLFFGMTFEESVINLNV